MVRTHVARHALHAVHGAHASTGHSTHHLHAVLHGIGKATGLDLQAAVVRQKADLRDDGYSFRLVDHLDRLFLDHFGNLS